MICCSDLSFTLCRSGLLFNTRFLFDFIRVNNFYILSPVPRTMLAGQAKWRGERTKKKKKREGDYRERHLFSEPRQFNSTFDVAFNFLKKFL